MCTLFPAIAISNITEVDDLKREITLAVPAKRIISLAPNITELLFHIGAGGNIVVATGESTTATGGSFTLSTGKGAATSSGGITVKTVNFICFHYFHQTNA